MLRNTNGFTGSFRSGFSRGFNHGKMYMPTGSNRLLYNAGNVVGRGVKLITVGAGKFFSTAKILSSYIGRVIRYMGRQFKVMGTTVWRGVKGFFLKLVEGVKKMAPRVKQFVKTASEKVSNIGKKIHAGYVKVADTITPDVKQYNALGLKKKRRKYKSQVALRARKVEKTARVLEGATVALGIHGITSAMNAFDNLPSHAKEED